MLQLLNPYLLFRGECEAAFTYYAKILGGKIEFMMKHEGSPMAGQLPAEWQNKVMHARLAIGNQVLMGSDPPPSHYEEPKGFSVSLSIDQPTEAVRIFHALAEKGQLRIQIQKTFWAERFGMLTDRFGIPWMINCEGKS